jgi:hypothetical protein
VPYEQGGVADFIAAKFGLMLQSEPALKNWLHDPNINVRLAARLEQPFGAAQPWPIRSNPPEWLECAAAPVLQLEHPALGGLAVATRETIRATPKARIDRMVGLLIHQVVVYSITAN